MNDLRKLTNPGIWTGVYLIVYASCICFVSPSKRFQGGTFSITGFGNVSSTAGSQALSIFIILAFLGLYFFVRGIGTDSADGKPLASTCIISITAFVVYSALTGLAWDFVDAIGGIAWMFMIIPSLGR